MEKFGAMQLGVAMYLPGGSQQNGDSLFQHRYLQGEPFRNYDVAKIN